MRVCEVRYTHNDYVSLGRWVTVSQKFKKYKVESHEKLRISKEKLEECDEETRQRFQQMEEVSVARAGLMRATVLIVP